MRGRFGGRRKPGRTVCRSACWIQHLLRSFHVDRQELSYAITMCRVAMRLFLALCLVLNGIGNAMAAAAMPATLGGPAHAAIVLVDAKPSASACDHVADAAAPAGELPMPPAPRATQFADCDQDCCGKGACSCPCMQLAQADLLDMPVLPAVSSRAQRAAVLSLGHPAPVPFNFIRPPIG